MYDSDHTKCERFNDSYLLNQMEGFGGHVQTSKRSCPRASFVHGTRWGWAIWCWWDGNSIVFSPNVHDEYRSNEHQWQYQNWNWSNLKVKWNHHHSEFRGQIEIPGALVRLTRINLNLPSHLENLRNKISTYYPHWNSLMSFSSLPYSDFRLYFVHRHCYFSCGSKNVLS